VQWRPEDLPAKQAKQDEQQEGIATNGVSSADKAEVKKQPKHCPNQHEHPKREA